MKVVIIDCGAGNLHSVRKAFASQLPEGSTLDVVTDAAALATATHIVLPGVGAFADCMAGLNALTGMRGTLEAAVLKRGIPFLGICVGMQMLFERGHEHGIHEGLGWFNGEVGAITPKDETLRIPHMGWNRLRLRRFFNAFSEDQLNAIVPPPLRGRLGGGAKNLEEISPQLHTPSPQSSPARGEGASHPLFVGINNDAFVYFVHSYAAQNCDRDEVLATVDYGGEIVSVIGRKNILGTQFHPEKSQAVGLRMINNFLAM